MVTMVPDPTRRFLKRPYYETRELDEECEKIISDFLRQRYEQVKFPVKTEDLTVLIEQKGATLDMYADLEPDVDGMTEIHPDGETIVRISKNLSDNPRQENRLRTTLTHEYGHVHFHADLLAHQGNTLALFPKGNETELVQQCKRENIYAATKTDWMEWQAGYICGALLMPRIFLAKLVEPYWAGEKLLSPTNISEEQWQALVGKVLTEFQVSRQAAQVRLEKLGYLGDHGPVLPIPD